MPLPCPALALRALPCPGLASRALPCPRPTTTTTTTTTTATHLVVWLALHRPPRGLAEQRHQLDRGGALGREVLQQRGGGTPRVHNIFDLQGRGGVAVGSGGGPGRDKALVEGWKKAQKRKGADSLARSHGGREGVQAGRWVCMGRSGWRSCDPLV